MTLFELLREDHKQVQALMETITQSQDRAQKKQELLQELASRLTAHNQAEEKVLYEALKTVEDEKAVAGESEKEHKKAESLLKELQTLSPDDAAWEETFACLYEAVLQHILKEEGEVFEATEDSFDAKELEAMAEAFREEKARIIQEG